MDVSQSWRYRVAEPCRALLGCLLLSAAVLAVCDCFRPQEQAEPSAQVERVVNVERPEPNDTGEPRRRLSKAMKRIAELEERVSQLELHVARILEEGSSRAEWVGYDPSRTTLSARNLQDAIDELASELKALQRGQEDMGQAGPGLFQLPPDNGRGQGSKGPSDAQREDKRRQGPRKDHVRSGDPNYKEGEH